MKAAEVRPNVVTYNTLIEACDNAGDLHRAFVVFAEMEAAKVRPNVVTYNTLMIKACDNAGDLELEDVDPTTTPHFESSTPHRLELRRVSSDPCRPCPRRTAPKPRTAVLQAWHLLTTSPTCGRGVGVRRLLLYGVDPDHD